MRKTTRIALIIAAALLFVPQAVRADGILYLDGGPSRSAAAVAADTAMINRIIADGYTVTEMDGHVATRSDFAGKTLLITSPTIGSSVILNQWNSTGFVTTGGDGAQYRNLPYPILNMQNGLSKNLGMTVTGNAGQGTGTNAGSSYPNPGNDIKILDASSPLAAGLAAGYQPIFTATPATLSVFGNSNFSILGNQVQPGVNIVASTSVNTFGNAAIDSQYAVIESIEKGTALGFNQFASYSAAATSRRVQFPLDPTGFNNLNANGLALFDAAINYAYAGPVPEPGSFALAVFGLAGLVGWQLRQRAKASKGRDSV